MARPALLLVAFAAAAHAESDLAARIEAANDDVKALRALRPEVEAFAKEHGGAEAAKLLRKLAAAFWCSDDREDEELLLLAAAIPGAELDADECLTLSRKFER